MPASRRTFLKTTLSLTAAASLRPDWLLAAAPTLRFAVASDGHYGQPNINSEKDFGDVVAWMEAEKRRAGLDFVVFNGDLIHDDPKFLPAVKRAFDRLTMPYFVTRGNHDMVSAEVWQQTWGYPLDHSFVRGDYAFLLLDTSEGTGKYVCPNLDFMKAQFAKHSDKKGIHVFMHISPVPGAGFGTNCPEVLELLDKTPNVKAIYHGHDHDADGRKTVGSKPYFWDAHFGGSWGTAYKGYRITEINADGYWKTYQYNPTASPVINAYDGKVSF